MSNLEQRVCIYLLNPYCTCLKRDIGECGGVGLNLAPLERRKIRWSLGNMLISVVMTCPEDGSMNLGKLSQEHGLLVMELIVSLFSDEGL